MVTNLVLLTIASLIAIFVSSLTTPPQRAESWHLAERLLIRLAAFPAMALGFMWLGTFTLTDYRAHLAQFGVIAAFVALLFGVFLSRLSPLIITLSLIGWTLIFLFYLLITILKLDFIGVTVCVVALVGCGLLWRRISRISVVDGWL